MDKLKNIFATKGATQKAEVKEFLKTYSDKVIDDVTISQTAGGMRDIISMLYETSLLDAHEGIRFRGYSIPELIEKLPKAQGGTQPLAEGIFWLMLTGDIPTQEDVNEFSKDLARRSNVPQHVFETIESLPKDTHPMTQFSLAVLAAQTESIFAKKYADGLSKDLYWDPMYEDALNLVARIPKIAAYIYRRTYKNGEHLSGDSSLDWSANFAKMLGYESDIFYEMMRLYMTIHADHEGGNASAHATHLAGSTLSDAYLSFSSGLNALAGPLHGLANQEVVRWITEMNKNIGNDNPSKEQIRDYINATLAAGKVVPGYGHAVLRIPDPRFTAQQEFAKKYMPDSPIVNTVWRIFEVAPEILSSTGKIKNPFPNVDAHSGSLLVTLGFNEANFYTVLFGVSRALGVMAALCWSRMLGLPLERPKSVTFEWLKKQVEQS
jgi:citrate synthase